MGAGWGLRLLLVVIVVVAAAAMAAPVEGWAHLPAEINLSSASGGPCAAGGALIIDSDYNFTGDISRPVVVAADNIVIDGKGYGLIGGGSGCGFNLTGRTNVTIRNVVVKGWKIGFLLDNSHNNTITNNTVKITVTESTGFELLNSNNNILTGNTISGESWEWSPPLVIREGDGWGFRLNSSHGNVLAWNVVSFLRYDGFYLFNSSHNMVSGNTIKYTAGAALSLESSSYNALTGNTIKYCYQTINLRYSSDNDVSGNTVISVWGYEELAGNNTVVITGPFILAAMLCNAYVSLRLHQQSVLPASALVLAASLAAAAIMIAAAYRRITGGRDNA
ncbi:MAG: NosD domain-containing protein [Candidatus Jordarchaeales archaeon]